MHVLFPAPGSLQKLFSFPEKLSLAELFVFFKTQFFLFYFIFIFSFIFISWRLITLQYCSGFCHTLT